MTSDLWRLGDHRLLCGDALCLAAIDTILQGARADVVFADAPEKAMFQGKQLELSSSVFLRLVCRNLLNACRGAIFMISSKWETLLGVFRESGGAVSGCLIRGKQHFTTQPALNYQREYETILYGWHPRSGRYWSGIHKQGDLWLIPPPQAGRGIPA